MVETAASGEKSGDSGQNILHYYRLATEEAAEAQTPDEEVAAYSQVVDFCENDETCRMDHSIKHNSILFWSHRNIGDAFMRKSKRSLHYQQECENAIDNYVSALSLARNADEKTDTLDKIAFVYENMGDQEHWLETKKRLVDALDVQDKSVAYLDLVDKTDDIWQKIILLEEALTYVLRTEDSIQVKGLRLLSICDQLEYLYHQQKKTQDEYRVKELSRRVADLLNNPQ